MKKLTALIFVSTLLSACSTMLIKNPENTTAQTHDKIHTSAAAPKTDLQRVETIIKSLSKDLMFESGSAQLKPKAVSALQELAEIIATESSVKIAVNGFTDSSGNEKINLPLSEDRAYAVGSILIMKGVPSDRVLMNGFSSKNPVADNTTPEGRAVNRRTELSLN
jgi:outer membrane protein OmpA-like peptidoglycan-associated protein